MFEISKEYMDKIETVKNHFGIKAQESYIWNELEELREDWSIQRKGKELKNEILKSLGFEFEEE